MHFLRIVIPVVAVILLAGTYHLSRNSQKTTPGLEHKEREKKPRYASPSTGRPPAPKTPPFASTVTLLPTSETSRHLHAADSSAQDDLSLIHSLIRSHRQALGGNPVGLNDEITASLTGRNPKGAASLLPNHPAISAQGELLDRWQTPYRFHAYSGEYMEIRSAGPDRKFFSSDDIVLRE